MNVWRTGTCQGCEKDRRLDADGNVMLHLPPLEQRDDPFDRAPCAGVGLPPVSGVVAEEELPEPERLRGDVPLVCVGCGRDAEEIGLLVEGQVRAHWGIGTRRYCSGSNSNPRRGLPV